MSKRRSVVALLALALVAGAAVAAGVIALVLIPRLRGAPSELPAPAPRPERATVLDPKKKTASLRLTPLPGTADVRVALDPSNAHQAWAFANLGKATDPTSLFARHGLTVELAAIEKASDRIAALRAMAASFKRRDAGSEKADGVHFITVSGDESGWFIDRANRALREIDPGFHAEIIALSGLSTGEDVVFGPPEWSARPQAAAGAAVAAVPDGDGWGLLLLWCAENRILVNLDQSYYDPRALNVVSAEDAARAAAVWSDEETVERIFLAEGADHRGWRVEKGEKGSVAVAGLATKAPADPRLATARDDAVVVTSTRRRPGQAPALVLGLAQWNAEHRDDVVRMLASLFTATQQLDKSRRDLAENRVQSRSDEDARWQAAQTLRDLFGGSADEWYDAADAASVKREDGSVVEIGGVTVAGLQRNLAFFGLGRSGPDGGRVAYERFASLRDQANGGGASGPATKWEDVFEPNYLRDVVRRYPDLARTDPTLPSFDLRSPDEPQELTYYLSFQSRSAELAAGSGATLFEVLAEIIRAGDARFEIHGHTDSAGSPEDNLELSRRRSQAVYDWLKDKLGTEFPRDVQVIPHGESELAVQDSIDGNFVLELMAKNRRVVLKIFPKKSSSA